MFSMMQNINVKAKIRTRLGQLLDHIVPNTMYPNLLTTVLTIKFYLFLNIAK